MKFSIRQLCTVVFVVSVICGSLVTYNSLVLARRNRLEQELLVDVFTSQISWFRKGQFVRDEPQFSDSGIETAFLALGVDREERWIPVPIRIMEQIELSDLQSSANANADQVDQFGNWGVVHSIENLSWVDSRMISLDYVAYMGYMRGMIIERMVFEYTDGKWKKVSEGEMSIM